MYACMLHTARVKAFPYFHPSWRMCFSEMQAGAKLSLNRQFMDERWSKHRVVTCLDWSPQVIKEHVFRTIWPEFTDDKQNPTKAVQFGPLHTKVHVILLSCQVLTETCDVT